MQPRLLAVVVFTGMNRGFGMHLKPAYETEMYVTAGGYIAIKQSIDCDDVAVLLSKEQAKIVAAELPRVISELDSLLAKRASEGECDAD